ncbi:LytR/AlgR family response regulator transcription factor [Tepidibacter formicigenes]|jgi:two-component system response regulator AgrA|uniref:Stage 0 sporulation protein A homolog n=1 Tax=Tepidibacter formicigenes DSM 15518 TaxID=1123349 RepID=A0A1M6TCR0_9FIRM|nr:LytTR family DNA-binding domain-containing protein [Tepidibacter formicigenes]SHK54558.1 two component transcriptional regulator, LytTR family [Tepidibacter formicigenes DSM 15518]
MFNVIVCEDNKEMLKRIVNIIDNYNNTISKVEYKFNIGLIRDCTDGIIEYVKKNLDKKNIYILDIELKNNQNGMNLAKEIRKYDKNGEIIFITNHSVMVMKIFKYKLKALDFIDKTDNIEYRLLENLDIIYKNSVNEEDESSITIKSGKREYILKLSEIIKFETTGIPRKIRVSTIDSIIEFNGSFKEIEKELDERFYKSHRACILNKDYIKMINKDLNNLYVLMKNGQKSLLSRSRIKGLMKDE